MDSQDVPPPACPHCGCTENKPKYNNNKKPNQVRVECYKCGKLFQRSPIRKVHPEGYKKEKVEEPIQYKVLIKQCDGCKSTDAKFYSLNNNDPLQPRYKCKNPNCKKVFTPFKKSQLLNQKRASIKNVRQPTTTSDTAPGIDSLRMSINDFNYNPFSLATAILGPWGNNSGMVNNNGPSTSYSSASNDAGYCMQTTNMSLHNASNDHVYNSIAAHNNNSGGACGLGRNAQNVYDDPSIHNSGISIHNQFQRDLFNLQATPPYPINRLPNPTNINDNASTNSSIASYHSSSFTNVPQILHEHEHNMQLNPERTYNLRFAALRQPFGNMFSGSIYQAPERVVHEGSTNNIDTQLNNPQQSGNTGPMRRNHQDTPPFNNPPY